MKMKIVESITKEAPYSGYSTEELESVLTPLQVDSRGQGTYRYKEKVLEGYATYNVIKIGSEYIALLGYDNYELNNEMIRKAKIYRRKYFIGDIPLFISEFWHRWELFEYTKRFWELGGFEEPQKVYDEDITDSINQLEKTIRQRKSKSKSKSV